jgi:hypothetical protein
MFTPACIFWQCSISDAIELRKLFLEVFSFCCCSSITPAFDESKWTFLNGALAEYEDPLDDDVCVDVSEYSMITPSK